MLVTHDFGVCRVFSSLDWLLKDTSHVAMEVNKDIVHRQNLERKKFIEHVKILMAAEVSVRKEWQRVINQFTHQRYERSEVTPEVCAWHRTSSVAQVLVTGQVLWLKC